MDQPLTCSIARHVCGLTRYYANKQSSPESSSIAACAIRSLANFFSEEVSGDCREAREEWSKEDANVSDIDRDVEKVEDFPNSGRGHHQAGIQSAARDATQGIPSRCVKPVPKFLVIDSIS